MPTEPVFNVASVKTCTGALGPFRRMAIWFQGCVFGCNGCCNPELQPLEPRHMVGLGELLAIAEKAREEHGVEGVTFIGGEPTLQAGLKDLARGLKGMGLGIIMFTGNRFEDLDPELVKSLDLVIDGRFERGKRDRERNLVGSTNQRLVEVTDRYHDVLDWFNVKRPDYVEMDVSGDLIIANGSAF